MHVPGHNIHHCSHGSSTSCQLLTITSYFAWPPALPQLHIRQEQHSSRKAAYGAPAAGLHQQHACEICLAPRGTAQYMAANAIKVLLRPTSSLLHIITVPAELRDAHTLLFVYCTCRHRWWPTAHPAATSKDSQSFNVQIHALDCLLSTSKVAYPNVSSARGNRRLMLHVTPSVHRKQVRQQLHVRTATSSHHSRCQKRP
jgi:hypothetical protein